MLQLDLDGARKAVEAQANLHAEQLEQQGRNLAGQVTAGVTQIEKLQVRGAEFLTRVQLRADRSDARYATACACQVC
jgi:hypothetical protein